MTKSNEMVSIIIPSYNVEGYINDCLVSVEQQTYPNIEIIVIDDGSEDNTLRIVEQFAKISKRNFKIFSQNNLGQSSARNKGLREANGKYIIFVDSDDWLYSAEAISKMVSVIKSEDADFVQCSFEFVKGKTHSKYTIPLKNAIEGNAPLVDMIKVNDLYTSPWAKIYSSIFLKNNNLFFIEGLVNEDTAFSILSASRARKVGFLNDLVYCSREREGSTSRTSFIRMFRTMHEILINTRCLLIEDSLYSKQIENLFEARYLRSMLYNLMQTAQRSNYIVYLDDWTYCFSFTEYTNKKNYIRNLPIKYRILVSLSYYKRIFFYCAKILKFLGFRMH